MSNRTTAQRDAIKTNLPERHAHRGAAAGRFDQSLRQLDQRQQLASLQLREDTPVQCVRVQWGNREINTRELTREALQSLLSEVQWRERGTDVQLALAQALEDADYSLPIDDRDLGRGVNDQMDSLNQSGDVASGVWYEHAYQQQFPHAWRPEYEGGHAPGVFARTAPMDWTLQAAHSASAALQAWLAGLTIAECASALVALHLDALRRQLGDVRFDACFGSADAQAVPECQRLRINCNHGDCIPAVLLKGAGTTPQGAPVLVLGAKYYFKNHDHYQHRHPDGAFSGENAVYLGNDPQRGAMWTGFGVGHVSTLEMFQTLLSSYNAARTERDYRSILIGSGIARQTIESEHTKGHSYAALYAAWHDAIHPAFINAEAQLDLQQLMAGAQGARVDGQGILLDLRAVERLKYS